MWQKESWKVIKIKISRDHGEKSKKIISGWLGVTCKSKCTYLDELMKGICKASRYAEGVCTVLFLAQKSNQSTWFSATLDFSLVFRWFSAFSPNLCTVVSKKTKLSCFGGFFSLVFKIQAIAWFSLSCLHAETRTKWKYYLLFKYYQSWI